MINEITEPDDERTTHVFLPSQLSFLLPILDDGVVMNNGELTDVSIIGLARLCILGLN